MQCLPEEQEAQTHDSGATDVVVHIGDGHVQQAPDSLIVTRAAIGHGDGVHAWATQNRILVLAQRRHQRVSLFQTPEHSQRDAHGEAS